MRKRFITLITICVGITVVLFSLIAVANQVAKNNLQAKLVDAFAGEETTIGKEVAASVSARFTGIENALTTASLDPDIENANPAVCNPTLKRYYTSVNLGVGNVGRVNTQGIFYCTINPKLLGKPASSLGSYVQTLFNDPAHTPVVSPLITVPGVAGYATALHVPVYNTEHQFIGSIGGAIYVNQLSQQLFSKVRFAQTGFVSVQDEDGSIIYAKTAKNIGKNYFSPVIQNQPGVNIAPLNRAILAARQGKTQTVSYTGRGGVKKIAAVQPVQVVPGHRWIIIVTVPQEEIANTYFSVGLNYAFSSVLVIAGIALLAVLSILLLTSYGSFRLQQTKDEFISLVSHQLRTPLTSIRLFSEMLADPAVGELNAKQKEYIGNVHESTLRMIRLVADILNISRIELHRMKVEVVKSDLTELVKAQIEEIRPLADEKHITLRATLPLHPIRIPINPSLYAQVVHNLLTNAVRYSPENTGEVTVVLALDKKDCELVVSDNGIGIPTEARKHIFGRFYRAENAIHAIGDGTGLGLYLVKMILQSTGGRIWFEDAEPGPGTVFHATIPSKGMTVKRKL